MAGNANKRIILLSALIVLLTDFGSSDHYTGVLKGVISTINPGARILDLSHGVRPGDILHGAYLLYAGYRFFPEGSIFCVVVDPGVGSSRHRLCIRTKNYYFVGPDNGVLWQTARSDTIISMIRLTRKEYFNPVVYRTFHGRDVFAPVCAHLSLDTDIHKMGEPIEQIIEFDFLETWDSDTGRELRVIHIDQFGNIILSMSSRSFAAQNTGRFKLFINDRPITQVFDTYAAAPENELFLIPGSTGFMEISMKNSSAAACLNAHPGGKAVLEG